MGTILFRWAWCLVCLLSFFLNRAEPIRERGASPDRAVAPNLDALDELGDVALVAILERVHARDSLGDPLGERLVALCVSIEAAVDVVDCARELVEVADLAIDQAVVAIADVAHRLSSGRQRCLADIQTVPNDIKARFDSLAEPSGHVVEHPLRALLVVLEGFLKALESRVFDASFGARHFEQRALQGSDSFFQCRYPI